MPIAWRFEPAAEYFVFSVTDPYTMAEWREAMTAILAAPVTRTRIALLVDRRDTEPITADAVDQMALFFFHYRQELAGYRAAIVVNSDAVFGMARMTQLRAELRMSGTIRPFRNHDDAVAWLTE
jgi:stage II sporulation SpoAA-like protein